jgi:choline dehydrogenase
MMTRQASWNRASGPRTLGPRGIGSSRPNRTRSLNGRTLPLGMGKVLGGGSSINGMIWARGHKSDWDFFASEAGDPAWSYESVLNIYRRIEDWHGTPDPNYRGTGGPVFVQPAPDPNPIAPALLEGARSVGIPTFDNQNGRMMEGGGGASIADLRVRDGKRQSIFRSYVFAYLKSTESHCSSSRTGHPANVRRKTSHWRGGVLRRQDPSRSRGT